MEQIKSEIRRCKNEKLLWSKDTKAWNSGMKVEELENKIKELKNKLYEIEYAELESMEKEEALKG